MAAGFEFGLTAIDLIRLRKFFKKSPKQFAIAGRNVINELAFGTRRESLGIIDTSMTIRNARFVKSSVWVDAQRGNPPLNSVEASVGSLRRERFSGWAEQELGRSIGGRGKKFRQPTMEARLGNERKQMVLKARMKPGPPIPSPRTRSGSNWRGAATPHLSRSTIMIMSLAAKRHKGPFIIDEHPKFPPGLYRFKGRKGGRPRIRMLQLFTQKKSTVKRVRWLTGGVARMMKGSQARNAWGRAVSRALPRRLR